MKRYCILSIKNAKEMFEDWAKRFVSSYQPINATHHRCENYRKPGNLMQIDWSKFVVSIIENHKEKLKGIWIQMLRK